MCWVRKTGFRATRNGRRRSAEFPLSVSAGSRACSPLPNMRRSAPRVARSEEHTSELQSLMRISYAVFCLKKNKSITCKIRQSSHPQNHNICIGTNHFNKNSEQENTRHERIEHNQFTYTPPTNPKK